MSETTKNGIFAVNVDTMKANISKNLKLKSDKASGLFKTAVSGFTKAIEFANQKAVAVTNEIDKRKREIGVLEDTLVDIKKEKVRNHIIETRLLSLLEVSDEEIAKQMNPEKDK